MTSRNLFFYGLFVFLFGLLAGLVLTARRGAGEPLPVLRTLPDFALTESSGNTLGRRDMRGRTWVFGFVFTRCSGPCPAISAQMARLQEELPGDVGLATVTLDPEHDTPEVLSVYASRLGADPTRWRFFTAGSKEAVVSLVREGFLVVREERTGVPPGEAIVHSPYLALVDREARLRGAYDATDPERVERLKNDAVSLLTETGPVLAVTDLPRVNAILNATAAVLLLLGIVLVKRKRIEIHKVCMMTAFAVSALFLVSYLFYHARYGSTRFTEGGALRGAYLAILWTHMALAAVLPVLVPLAIYRGMAGQIERHKRIAAWTFPIWLYVSVTGVVVYWMLYHLSR